MIKLPFTKMQGLGNDFMVVDATIHPLPLNRQQIQAAADRHYGVGFDQLLVVEPAPSGQVDFNYKIFNADGSMAEQCGNGARCLARFIHERGLSAKKELSFLTSGKITRVILEPDQTVTVELQEPYFEPARIPFNHEGNQTPPYKLNIAGKTLAFHVAGVGNPHAVILDGEIEETALSEIGHCLSTHPCFPEGVNVGFMQIQTPERIQLQVYERGTGLTLACGSGACAAVAVGRKLHLLSDKVDVKQPGGELCITWSGPGSALRMRGPAQFVYEGNLFLTKT